MSNISGLKNNGFSGFFPVYFSLWSMDFSALFWDNLLMNKGQKKPESIDLSKMSRSELEDEFIKLYTRCSLAEAKVDRFLEELRLGMSRRYGRSSEKDILGQLSFSDLMKSTDKEPTGQEPADDEEKVRQLVDEAVGGRKKGNGINGPIPKKDLADLEVRTIEFKRSAEEQICPECGEKLEFVKNIVRRELTVEAPVVHVTEYVTAQYVCRNCAANDRNPFFLAEGAPKPLFYNSPASPALVADSIHKKYALSLPFDRQAKEYARRKIPITKDNLCKWSMNAAFRIFKPVCDEMLNILKKEAAIHCDETYTQVIRETNHKKSYVWVTTTSEYQKDHPIMLYHYRPGRSDADAKAVLDGFKGYVMCDGYACYNSVLNRNKKTGAPPLPIRPVACMVHIKREFVDALKGLPKKYWQESGAYLAVAKLQNIFHTDNEIEFSTYEERKEKRMGDLYAAMKDFFDYIRSEKNKSLPSTKYGRAITYALNQEEKAMRLFEDGRLELDNNMAERTVKPYVINRKNSLFNNTERGAQASCILFSIVETAKQNHLDVYKYLEYVLDQCRGIHKDEELPKEKIKKLLPWSKQLPDNIRIPQKD